MNLQLIDDVYMKKKLFTFSSILKFRQVLRSFFSVDIFVMPLMYDFTIKGIHYRFYPIEIYLSKFTSKLFFI